ncbi:DUF3850 domain-containing protein [Cronobacter sakazakii]
MSEIREPITHNLKIWPEHYSAVCAGVKRAELRKNDRDYRVGDTLDLCEWDKDDESFTGEFISVTVTHVADVSEWMPGYVLLSIELALRERAEPVAVVNSNMRRICKKCSASIVGYSVDGLCEDCYLAAPPAPVVADDSLPYDPQIAEYEQMMEAEQAETDTTSQQFESLAGKAVSGSEGFECTPVADLYELLTKCGECYDYTTSAKVAADWIKEGYSAREYVKLDRLQEAMTQGSPGEADGWIPCSERMPDDGVSVLAYCKCGDNFSGIYTMRAPVIRSKNSRKDDSVVHHERVTHWMPL